MAETQHATISMSRKTMHFLLYLSLGSSKKETMKQPEVLDANVELNDKLLCQGGL
jgi:hypothetical protein